MPIAPVWNIDGVKVIFSNTEKNAMTRQKPLNPIVAAVLATVLAGLGTPALADLSALVAVDASAQKTLGYGNFTDLASSLGKATGQTVRVERNSNFADVLRSTRTGEYDIYIVPGHVAASAASHGYVPVAADDKMESFVLVAKSGVSAVKQLKGGRLYLGQQDSIQSYMAKGLLNESGLSLKELGDVQYRSTSGAGLVAVSLGVVDATVVSKSQYQEWSKSQTKQLVLLLESKPVPASTTLLVKKTVPDSERERLTQWAGSQAGKAGLGRLTAVNDAAASNHKYLGGLGNFTPVQLPGVTRVSASEAADLIKKGAQMADVRSEKEFTAKHIAGAVLIPYTESSMKDISFDSNADSFTALGKLDKKKPAIFACNGAECWKSYKASKAALGQDFKQVYWLRGGLPEWEALGLPVVKN